MLFDYAKRFLANIFKPRPAALTPSPRAEYKDRQFFFLHIPKTAGTSFRLELEQHFDEAFILPNKTLRQEIGGYPPFSYIADLSQQQFNNFKLISGHYQYREAIERFSQHPLILLMMREPLSRCLSECRHILRHADHDMRAFLPSDPSLIDISKSHEVMHYLANVVSMMLLPDLNESKQLIRNCAFVGIQERMQESSLLLADTFGWPAGDIPSLNAAPQSQQALAQQLSAIELQRFKKILEPEYELYNYACELFESRLARTTLNQSA